jgi:hypothetical protein
MEYQQLRSIILNELPTIMQNDPALRKAVLEISRAQFADRTETDSRFEHMMARLERLMDEDSKKWEKMAQRLEENQKQIVALNSAIQSLEQRLDRKNDEDHKKFEEDRKKWEENQRRWDENQKQIVALNSALQNLDKKYERLYNHSLGALGARWGTQSEASFRNALAGILKEFPGVQVTHVTEKDESGVVFGRPDQVELDLIIKNGLLMICEIKSSIGKSEMYTFERKVRFYEQKHDRQANRMIVISPMVDPHAMPVAENLGIEVYSYADDVNL